MVLRVVLIPDRRVMEFDEPGLILGEIVQRLGLDQEDITVVVNGMIIDDFGYKVPNGSEVIIVRVGTGG